MKNSNNIFHQNHVCPWWLIYLFDNPIRRLFHNPQKIFEPYIHDEMTIFDIGCGMGYFSIGLAKLVGDKGMVIAIDVQEKMLNGVKKRALKAGLNKRIHLHHCNIDSLDIELIGDFVLTFWMAHEVLNTKHFMNEIYSHLKNNGKYLLVEPVLHVSKTKFYTIVNSAKQAGFQIVDHPNIALSRAVLFEK